MQRLCLKYSILVNNSKVYFYNKRIFPLSFYVFNKLAISEFPRPMYQNEVKCSAFEIDLMQIKLIFTRKVVRLSSF